MYHLMAENITKIIKITKRGKSSKNKLKIGSSKLISLWVEAKMKKENRTAIFFQNVIDIIYRRTFAQPQNHFTVITVSSNNRDDLFARPGVNPIEEI